MKNLHSLLLAACVAATTVLTSCEKTQELGGFNPSVTPVKYNGDITRAVDINFTTAPQTASNISLDTDVPFTVAKEKTIADNKGTITSDGKKVTIMLTANGSASTKAYTREVVAYIQNAKGYSETFIGLGEFFYPVIVRQTGALGTKYLSAAELKALKGRNILQYEWTSGDLASVYIKGRITAISDAYTWEGFKQNNGLYLFPFIAAITCDRKKPYELEAKDLTIDVDGTPVTVQATWGRAYRKRSLLQPFDFQWAFV